MFIMWLSILAVAAAAIYWFDVPSIVKVAVAEVAATVRMHLKFIVACWLLLTTRR